jgi:hypothetical protein
MPHMSAPCDIGTREEAAEILAEGPFVISERDTSNCGPAQVLLDMLDLGISRWHPDPLRAIAAARA